MGITQNKVKRMSIGVYRGLYLLRDLYLGV